MVSGTCIRIRVLYKILAGEGRGGGGEEGGNVAKFQSHVIMVLYSTSYNAMYIDLYGLS